MSSSVGHILQVLALLLVAMPAFAQTSTFPKEFNSFWNREIKDIKFVSHLGSSEEDLANSIPLNEGQRLFESDLSAALDLLSQRNTLANVDVELRADGEGVVVLFLLSPTRIITEAEFPRKLKFDPTALKRFAAFPLGKPLNLDTLLKSQKRLQKAYINEGYYQATVKVKLLNRKGAPGQLIARFVINEGQPSLIQSVTLDGEIPEPLKEPLADLIESAKGKRASRVQIDRLRKSLTQACRDHGYLQASLRLSSVTVTAEGESTDVAFVINPRLPVEIQINGNNALSRKELLAPLRLDTRAVPISVGSIDNLCDEIRELYQDEGYYYAKTHCERGSEEKSKRIFTIKIDEGDKVELTEIRFSGNKNFTDRKLREQMRTAPRGWWFFRRWYPGNLEDDQLEDDVEALNEFYHQHGYLEATVNSRVHYNKESESLTLEIKIKEKKQTQISTVDIEWSAVIDSEQNSKSLSELIGLGIVPALKEGDPFSGEAIDNERRKLERELARNGFMNAEVAVVKNEEEGSVRFVVKPQQQVVIKDIIIQGNRDTLDRIIRREVEVEPGDVWDISKVEQSQANIVRQGLFRNVSLAPLDGTLDGPEETLAVSVTERDTGSFSAGLGIDTEDGLHLSGELSQRNLGGTGRSLISGVDGFHRSNRNILDAGQGHILFVEPRFLESRVQLLAEAFGQFDVDLIKQYNFDRIGTSLMIQSDPLKEFTVSTGVRAYTEDLFDVEPSAILSEDDEGSSFYNLLRFDVDWDQRNDRFNPTRGYHMKLASKLSADELGSDVSFYGLSSTNSLYTPLGGRFSLINQLRGDYLKPFGETGVVPISSRVFLGGHNSLRGFSRYAVGPRAEDGTVVGGDLGVVFSTDFLIAFSEVFQTSLFLDVGQAFIEKADGLVEEGFDYSRMRFSPGIGIRYKTPIGPITADLGFALDREFGERFGRFYIGIGSGF